MKSRKGAKKSRVQEPKADPDTLAPSDDSVVVSQGKERAATAAVKGSIVAGPSFHALPAAQQHLLHHMSSIAQLIETGGTSNLVVYLKRLPT